MRFVGLQPLQGVVDPVAVNDAATKQYVDTQVAAGGGGAAGLTRKTVTVTATAAAAGANRTLTAALGASYVLLSVRTTAPARVRLYPTAAAAAADASRAVTADPAATVPLILEYVTGDTTAVPVTPGVFGAPFGQAGTTVIVTNNSASTTDLSVELTYLAMEV